MSKVGYVIQFRAVKQPRKPSGPANGHEDRFKDWRPCGVANIDSDLPMSLAIPAVKEIALRDCGVNLNPFEITLVPFARVPGPRLEGCQHHIAVVDVDSDFANHLQEQP